MSNTKGTCTAFINRYYKKKGEELAVKFID